MTKTNTNTDSQDDLETQHGVRRGGIKGRSGPPGNSNALGKSGGRPSTGNGNAISHGVYAFLNSGRLPEGAEEIETDLADLRNELEAATVACHGEVSLARAAIIESAVRHEAVCRLLIRWLAQNEHLTTDQRLKILNDLSRATDKRDAAIARLELEEKGRQENPYSVLVLTPQSVSPG